MAGLTQEEASRALLIALDRYRKIEQGTRKPNGDELLRIREVLRKAEIDERGRG